MRLFPLSKVIFDKTREHWGNTLVEFDDISPGSYFHALDAAEMHLKGANRDNYYVYALCSAENEPAMALVDISYALPRTPQAWLKALTIRPAPEFDLRLSTPENYIDVRWRVSEIGACIITESLRLSNETYPANIVKIYAGHNDDYELLTEALKSVDKNTLQNYGVLADTYRNWIQLTKIAL